MNEAKPPWKRPAPVYAGGRGSQGKRRRANHGKPWDCKAMGTKALSPYLKRGAPARAWGPRGGRRSGSREEPALTPMLC